MNPLIEKEFNKNMSEIEDAEIIPVKPGSDTLSGPDNQNLSKFKQQRLKEKEKKMKRKIQQAQKEIKKDRDSSRPLASDLRKAKHNVKTLTHGNWNQVRSLISTINNTINKFRDVAIQAVAIPTISGVEIAPEGVEILTSKSNIIFRDIQEFQTKVDTIFGPHTSKQGKVNDDDLPDFFAVYEELLSVNQDVINVLTDPAIELTSFINLVQTKIREANEEHSKSMNTTEVAEKKDE